MSKSVYILGAGFSRYANLPLMNDFFFRAKDYYFKLSDEKDQHAFKKIFKYVDDFSIAKNIINTDFYNIEELLSIIEMDAFLNNKRKIYSDYILFLKRVIELATPKEQNQDGYYMINENIHTKTYSVFLTENF